MALEKPKYKVVQKNGRFELRDYAPYIASRVEVTADDHRAAARRGFSPLAGYIFGENFRREKIAMTAPVTAQPASEKIAMTAPVTVSGDDTYRVEFVIPAEYSLNTLPVPKDKRVEFVEYPARRIAAVRFSGAFQQRNFDRHIALLRAWIRNKGWAEKSAPVIAGYNPPFTPWFLKHNEVLIEVEPEKD